MRPAARRSPDGPPQALDGPPEDEIPETLRHCLVRHGTLMASLARLCALHAAQALAGGLLEGVPQSLETVARWLAVTPRRRTVIVELGAVSLAEKTAVTNAKVPEPAIERP